MRAKLSLSLAAFLTTASAFAEIYKSVGTNGKLIYTNITREGKAPAGKVLRPSALRIAVTPSSPVAAVRVDAPLSVPVRHIAARLPARTPAGDGSHILTPDVIGAVANVMGVAQLVSSSREFCVAAMPTAHKRYSSAAQGWEHRNSAVVAQKDRVLSHPVQQLVAESLSVDMVRKTATLMQPVKLSDTAARVQWCDKAFADVDRGVLDLVGRPSIAPLMNYGRR